MFKNEGKPRWSVERRLEFIDFRLYWVGHINRGDLIETFGISLPQASADIAQYLEVAPGNAEYDKTGKKYVSTQGFKPKLFSPTADSYFSQLKQVDAGVVPEGVSVVGDPPPFAVLPVLSRRDDPEILRLLLTAIRSRASIDAEYQSFTKPGPQRRRLSPHALVSDGFRWHVRGWCYTREEFRDFVIGRFLSVRDPRPDGIDPSKDTAWTRQVTLKIGPHPKMQDGARRMTELNYGMEGGVVKVTARACMVPFLKRRYGLSKDPKDVTPNEQQIVLLNRDEVDLELRSVGVTFGTEQGGN